MPLSEDEQRILQDIERNFYENDPAFVKAVSQQPSLRHATRNCRLAVLGFIVGVVLLGATFVGLPLVGFVGFVLMVANSVVFVKNFKRVEQEKDVDPVDWVRTHFRKPGSDSSGK